MIDRFKFRAWCTKHNRFENHLLDMSDGMVFSDAGSSGGIIEQCTGLKDKYGTLIYEGDILKFQIENEYGDTSDYIKPVVYHYDLSLFGFPVTVQGSYKTPIENYANALYQADWNSEVIGNIHENPELLK